MSRRGRSLAAIALGLSLMIAVPRASAAQSTSSTTTTPTTTTTTAPAASSSPPASTPIVDSGAVRELSTSQFATFVTILIAWTSLVWAFIGHRVRKARSDAEKALEAVEHLDEVLSVLDRLLRHLTVANEQQRALIMRLLACTNEAEKLPGLAAEVQAIGFDLQRSMLELVLLGAEADSGEVQSSCKQLAQQFGDWESVSVVKLALKRSNGDQDLKRLYNELRRRLKWEQQSHRSPATTQGSPP